MLALGKDFFRALLFFHLAFSVSLNHAFNCSLQSACFVQNFRKIGLAITLKSYPLKQIYNLVPIKGTINSNIPQIIVTFVS